MKTCIVLSLFVLLASACASAEGPTPATRAATMAGAPSPNFAAPHDARRGEGSARAARAER